MFVPILLLLALGAKGGPTLSKFTEDIEESVLPVINNFRSYAATGNMTEKTTSFTQKLIDHVNNKPLEPTGDPAATDETQLADGDWQQFLKDRLAIRMNNTFGPMANVRKLEWNGTLQNLSMVEECPFIGGGEYNINASLGDWSLLFRRVAVPLNFTDVKTISEALEKYFDVYVERQERVHPPYLEEGANHTDWILGEFYMAERDEVGCTVHNRCRNGSVLVCMLSPGKTSGDAFIEGNPGTACSNNYVPENDTLLCILDPRLNWTQIDAIRTTQRSGKPVALMVVQEEPDGAARLIGTLILAIVIWMAWE